MQTPVRFYITESDDQPVVRSTPVVRPPRRAFEQACEQTTPPASAPCEQSSRRGMKAFLLRRPQPDQR